MVGVILFISILQNVLGMVLTNNQCYPLCTSVHHKSSITIRYSNVTVIQNKTFDNCAAIKTLHITNSNIQQIELNTFRNLLELEELDLSNNFLTYLSDQFKNLTSLQRLNLYNNDLHPGKDLFTNLYSLRYLNMSKNYIIFLNNSIFKNNGELQELYLSSNCIDYLPNGIFNNQTKLHELNLDRNRLVEIHKELFSKMTKLRVLNLSFNSISRLETGTFDNNKAIQQLYLQFNAITILPEGIFKNLENLITISLGHNRISSIGQNVFPENLQQVYLQKNQLKYLDASFLKLSDRLLSLDLYDNPWNCDCHLQAFFNVTKKFHKNVKCDKPKQLKLWSDLTSNHFQCEIKPEKTCIRDAKKFSYTINASNIFCKDDNDGIFVTNGHRYKMKVNDTRLEFKYIDVVEIDTEPQCLEGVLIAVETVLLVIVFIVTYLLVTKLKQRAYAISQNDSRRNTNIYTEPLPHATVDSSSLPVYVVENKLYGFELKTN